MRLFLRLLALALFLGTAVWWVQSGKNPGWTKNKVFVEKVDEITGISYPEEEDRFVPGVDLLAASGGVSLVIAALSFLRRPRRGA
jgi:hypothetical protein